MNKNRNMQNNTHTDTQTQTQTHTHTYTQHRTHIMSLQCNLLLQGPHLPQCNLLLQGPHPPQCNLLFQGPPPLQWNYSSPGPPHLSCSHLPAPSRKKWPRFPEFQLTLPEAANSQCFKNARLGGTKALHNPLDN